MGSQAKAPAPRFCENGICHLTQRLTERTSLPILEAAHPEEARPLLKKQKPADLFPHARAPEAALGGLFLYFSCAEECHELVQNLNSAEGVFWHAIRAPRGTRRDECGVLVSANPNASGISALARAAEEIAAKYPAANFRGGVKWDPFYFIEFSEQARREPGSPIEAAAREIQRAEWELLFDYCARSRS